MRHTLMMTAALLLGLGLLSGCTETIDSTNVKTRGIAALIEATASSDASTTVVATLKAGGDESNTYVILGGGDRIFASAGDQRVEMQAQSSGVYEAKFNSGKADLPIKVDLQRENDDDAPSSTGNLPAPFDIAALPTDPVSRASDLTIAWAPTGSTDSVKLELNGNCIFLEVVNVPGDTGKHVIAAGTLKPTNPKMGESCPVTVKMTRSRKGTPDGTFDSESWFVLEQVRTASFTSAP
jgi:hypothetical protein